MLWNMVLHILSVIEGYLLAVYTWPVVKALVRQEPAGNAPIEAAAAVPTDRLAAFAAGFRGRLDALLSGRIAAAVKDWFLHSATILWARLVALAGLLLTALDWLANLAGLPGVSENIRALLAPQYVPWYLIAIAIITELARRRTLRRGDAASQFLLAGQGSGGGEGGGAALPEAAPGKGFSGGSSVSAAGTEAA